jgi:hypothetical protein
MKDLSLLTAASAIVFTLPIVGAARNPVVQTNFTADPAPMVVGDTVYLYTSHDEDDAPVGMGRFHMLNWKCYSSKDMANWTDHGTVASLATFPWAWQDNDAWAPQVVERNGKFYLYAPVSVKGWPKNVIAVAVAESPTGPFVDAIGQPLLGPVTGYIDPTVFVDDDGQAYLYFGNPNLWYVKLNADMISYSGKVMQEPTKPENYQEGPWFYKRGDHYYMAYASTCCPEGIGYAMSDSPTGPWSYRGYVMRPNEGSSGNHPGIVDFKGASYVFGFNYKLNFALTDDHHERRSVCVAKFDYNPDGSIPELPWWEDAGVPQIGTLDPYTRVEAETFCWSGGVKTEPCAAGGMNVCGIRNRAFLMVKGVDFVKGAKCFFAGAASATRGGSIELHLDAADGPTIGTCTVENTGAWQNWETMSCPVKDAAGVHDLYLVFNGGEGFLFNLDWWRFLPGDASAK